MKIYSLMMLAVALMGTACNQDKSDMEGGATAPTMRATASIDAEGTRTVLDGLKVLWNGWEMFTVSNGTQTATFEATLTQPSPEAEFVSYDAKLMGDAFLAVYPYVKDAEGMFDIENKTIRDLTISEHQFPSLGSFDYNSTLMVAYATTTESIHFRNAHSLAKFTVAGEGVSEVVLKADNALAGRFTIDLNTMENTENSDAMTITVKPIEGGNFMPNATYYVSVLPGTKQNFKLLVNGIVAKEVESATFLRNKIHNMGEVSAVKSGWQFVGSINGWGGDYEIPFYDQAGNFYVAKNVTLKAGDEYKIKKGDNDWRGCNYSQGNDSSKVLWPAGDAGNTKVSANGAGTYDIYLHKTAEFMLLVEQPDSFLSVIGNGDWGNDCAYFTIENGLFVAYYVEMTGIEFKLRANQGWLDSWGSGSAVVLHQANGINYNGGNMTVDAGTYNIYTDLKKIWITSVDADAPTISY